MGSGQEGSVTGLRCKLGGEKQPGLVDEVGTGDDEGGSHSLFRHRNRNERTVLVRTRTKGNDRPTVRVGEDLGDGSREGRKGGSQLHVRSDPGD